MHYRYHLIFYLDDAQKMIDPTKIPSKEDLQYFDQCFVQSYREQEKIIIVIREHPQSNQLRGFEELSFFGAAQQAVLWLKANRRK